MAGGISGIGSFGMGSVGSFYQSRLTENLRNARSAQQARQAPVQATVRRAASPETPVRAVTAVRPISRDEASVPELAQRLENDAAAMAGRMRTKYGEVNREGVFVETGRDGLSPADGEDALKGGAPKLPGQEEEAVTGLPGQKDGKEIPGLPGQEDEEEIPGLPGQKEDGEEPEETESAQETAEEGKCQTCEKRKYQDGSDDPGVSFKTPTNIKPEQAASAVRGHEMEHVVREQAQAKREGRKVVSQTVTMHTGICPECGKVYVSGGTTRTVTKADTDNDARQDDARQDGEAQKPSSTAA